EFHEGHFSDFMAAVAAAFAWFRAKLAVDMINIAADDVEESALAGRVVVRNGRLGENPRAIDLVTVPQISPAFARPHPDEPGVHVAVWQLQPGEHVDDAVDHRFDRIVATVG